MTGSYDSLRNRIDNVLELSTVCRGELCRELESEVDRLEDELLSLCMAESSCSTTEVKGLEAKINKSISNFSPNIHI